VFVPLLVSWCLLYCFSGFSFLNSAYHLARCTPQRITCLVRIEHVALDTDSLTETSIHRLPAHGFANERSGLEKQWDRGDNVSTEDLWVALQRYRSFFDRLLKL
jgi:hypothetical protein